jgi:hypothetical protein
VRTHYPFRRDDLRELRERLLERADEVVAMREIAAGERHPNVIGLRHDVDNLVEPSVELAEWEHRHGFRATYFVLHDSPYWNSPELRPALETIAGYGHEIGIHANAISVALEQRDDPQAVLGRALARLRKWGHTVTGVAAHGDPLCYTSSGAGTRTLRYVNDEIFAECSRPEVGRPRRKIRQGDFELELRPIPLADHGLAYATERLGRRLYLSDSGGQWSVSFAELCERFPHEDGQLHVLIHPCWWLHAFPVAVREAVA